ncbi:MAG: hypothetical protein OEV49_05065 [candidate division Zixibacteria bacterium]|nr:hypothetical protein [candidate division Zixibacteria bacterium]MDH3936126.1 hypothetical protein [candidate division Zixibacteria bacterium]MDH4035606.1 hypothetical protein [candidate division Zixibacteria bacterium]
MQLCSRSLMCLLLLAVLPALASAANDSDNGDLSSEEKSTRTGQLLSLGCFAIPAAIGGFLLDSDDRSNQNLGAGLVWVGVGIGPGMGHRYANQRQRFLTGLTIRTSLFAYIAVMRETNRTRYEHKSTSLVYKLAIAACIASAVYDFATIDSSVKKYNNGQAPAELGIFPTYNPGSNTSGIVLAVRF